jgi:23S rRNA pseudouridine1911/1915/1917 synthase
LEQYSFVVEPDDDFRRVDLYLQEKIGSISRTRVQKLIADGHVTVNGSEVRGSYKPREGDEIEAVVPDPQEFHLIAEDIPLDIVHEDDEIVVINKPAGMVVHPAPGHWTGTLVNALLYHVKDFKGISGQTRPGLVHRLDMETSGLLVVAKSDKSLSFLADEMKERRIKRKYVAFVWGHLPDEDGRIDAPIGRSRKDRKKMTVTNLGSRQAVTKYRVLTKYLFADKLELQLQTGRTHQIRVHLSHIGHPVIGDPDYGGREKAMTGIFDQYRKHATEILKAIDRQALHAYKLSFRHPSTNLEISFESQLPDDMELIKELLNSEPRTR